MAAIQLDEFVNSKSMITPGVAGAIVMTITNAIDFGFGCGPYIPHFVLGFSFLAGLLVLADPKTSKGGKFALYVINSLLIFSTSIGANTLGDKITGQKETEEKGKENIETTISPVGPLSFNSLHDEPFTVVLVQQVQETDQEKKIKELRATVSRISSEIITAQKELVDNQKIYNDPKAKLDRLVSINNELLLILKLIKSDTTLSNDKAYRESLKNVQQNVDIFEDALSIEKKNHLALQQKRTFFKPWFNSN